MRKEGLENLTLTGKIEGKRSRGRQRRASRENYKKQLEFLGHVMRKEGRENLTLTGKIEGKCSRGRQRKASKEN